MSKVRPFLVNVKEYDSYIIEDTQGVPLVFFVLDRSVEDELRLPVLRLNRRHIDKKLIRHLLLQFLATAASEGRDFTRVVERSLRIEVKKALQEDAFVPSGDTWIKANVGQIATATEISNYIEGKLIEKGEPIKYFQMTINDLRDPNAVSNTLSMSEIESVLWPVKISDAAIDTISISISPDWAGRWFDSGLADQTLFGAQEEKAFNREGIYYSLKPLKSIALPARVLWYVTKDTRLAGTASIRACSQLNDIIVGSAKDIFRRFQHLGIFEWKNIMTQTGDPDAEIAAYRFSDTILFKNPVPYEEWEKLTKANHGKKPNRQSPARVPRDVFQKIYELGVTQ